MDAAEAQPPPVPAGERRPATEAEAKVLASTLRMRILRVCLHEAHSNKEIAQILDRDPATTLHHVRRLVDTGFLAAQPVRRGTRGSREIPYLATGKSWNLSMPGGDQALLDTFLEEVALVSADQVDSARLGIKVSPAAMQEFRDRLRALLDDVARLPDDPEGQAWSVFLSIHPDPNQP